MNRPRYQIDRPSIIDEVLGGEVVAVDLAGGRYYSLRASGVDIWELLSAPVACEDLVAEVADRYGLEPAAVREPIERFVAELKRAGLLREVADGGGAETSDPPAPTPTSTLTPTPTPAGAFEVPVLETFTDMEDLLILDPIDDVDPRGWPHARDVVDAMGWPTADQPSA